MPVIETFELTKIFHVQKKDPGLRGAVKALFRPKLLMTAAYRTWLFGMQHYASTGT